MNEEIKAFIERERNEAYHKETSCLSITDEEYQGYRDGYDKGIDKGIEIALSLFKWRKVSGNYPKVEKVLIKVMCYFPNGHKCIRYTTGVIFNQERHSLDDDFIKTTTSRYEIIEWMPIPEGGGK